ncbi:hypothetical protein YPPY60_0675, partial [Yersinia pestis PY-60]
MILQWPGKLTGKL